MIEADKGAARILAHIAAVYVPTHDYQRASPRDFKHLNLKFYDRTLKELGQSGYTHLADIEDITLTNAPGSVIRRTMIRSMLSADGTVMASAYDVKLKFVWWLLMLVLRKLPAPVVDFETELTDGAFIVTSNAEIAAAMKQPPILLTEYHPKHTTTAVLMATHIQRLAAYKAVTGASPLIISSHGELVASQNRMNALKAAYRNQLGAISAEELERLSNGRTDIAKRMQEKIVELRGRAT